MKYSLHFGLNRVNPDAYGGWAGFLNACENDAVDLMKAMIDRKYSANVRLDEQCTLQELRNQMATLARITVPGDTVVITYSGHGGQQVDGFGSDETICLFDGQMVDKEFIALLGQFKAGVAVIVVFDSCHSGGFDKALLKTPRSAPASTHLRVEKRSPRGPDPEASVVELCACQKDETASDGAVNGAWTGALLKALPQAVCVADWFTRACEICPRDQHPIIHHLGPAGALRTMI